MTFSGTDLTRLHIKITDANGKDVVEPRHYSAEEALDELDGVVVSLMNLNIRVKDQT